jgi:hypothetical protein
MSLRGAIRAALNQILKPCGLEFKRIAAPSYPLSERMREDSINAVVRTLEASEPFFSVEDWPGFLARTVPVFFERWSAFPIPVPDAGCGFNTALVLFLAARLADPEVIIESGTFMGGSSWVWRSACPNAELHCFDLSFDALAYRHPSIIYHEHNWTDRPLSIAAPGRSLCYFDDHVNQAQRVLEAAERGFNRLVFDDNVPAHALHKDGYPPVPTIDMICDDSLKDGDVIEWVSHGRYLRYHHQAALVSAARQLVTAVRRAPRLQAATGYPPETDVAFVCLQ